ncbi:MAG: MATE family efflux transporter [Prevotella sp.]|nr:MATE family efflux transporter [Prevotella sp.]
MARAKELTVGRPAPLIARFTLPLLLGNMLQQTYSLVDAVIVGKVLGISALASVGASSSVIFLILGFCNGCQGGFSIPVAWHFGARDYSMMRRYFCASLRLTAILSVVIALLTSVFCKDILRLMSTPEGILDGAYIYLLITFLGIPCTFFYNLLSGIIRALGDSKTPLYFLLFSTILNILLDLLCIIVLGWGVAGAAIATVFSQGLSAVLCYVFMLRAFDILRSVPDERRMRWPVAKRLLAMGLPMGLQFSITAIGSIMLQSSNNALGTACVAAFTAATRIKMFLICPMESLGIAMATFCGQNYGARKPQRIREGVLLSMAMMVAYAVAVWLLLLPGARYAAMLFASRSEAAILSDTALFLHVGSTFYWGLGAVCVLRSCIQAVSHTRLALLSGATEMVARIIVSLFLVPAFGFIAVCYGDPAAWLSANVFLIPASVFIWRRMAKSV